MAGDVVSGEAVHSHHLQDAGGNGFFHAKLLHGRYELAVELRRPVDLSGERDAISSHLPRKKTKCEPLISPA